ncbi:MAG: HD domain-containing protein [Gallionellaceae bacterium]|nr:MAG: HD domain-containing protein [Gallionellaceae bacterium]
MSWLPCARSPVPVWGSRHAARRSPDNVMQDERVAMLFMLEDMERARKQIEEMHLEWIKALDAIDDPIFLHDRDFRVLRANRAYQRLAGVTFKELVGRPYYEIFPKMDAPLPCCQRAMENAEEEILYAGRIYRSIAAAVRNEQEEYQFSIHILEDVTEFRKQQTALQQINHALNTIRTSNQTLLHAQDERRLLQDMCDVAVKTGTYRAALVGYAQDDADKSVLPMAHCGFEPGEVDTLKIIWADVERGQGPTGRAIRTGQTQLVHHLGADPGYAPWRMHAMKLGVKSGIALPLRSDGKTFGCLTIYAVEEGAFTPEIVSLLEEMAGDLAFGIITLRLREAHREHERRLQKNMLQTVEAIASIVEMRDPYTSGHQVRVAELAREIARQMGLTADEQQAIHLAGLVHDLGKISIPADILSKPGRLNEAEYSLIKRHPQAGYDILKGVDFSWPIAQMVWQHHERLDGSGYPLGLQGDEILLGARILSVADIVEAMSSHRPYRPGLGMEAALEEIGRGRGTHYDAQVVEACIALFKEHGYVFPK